MSLNAGNRNVVTGTMARAIYDEIEGELDGFEPDPDDPGVLWARLSAAIARGVVEYLVANTDVSVTIETTDSALQRDPATNADTRGPSAARSLGGTIS